MTFFSSSSSSSPPLIVNGAEVQSGQLQVEVLNEKDFVVDGTEDEDFDVEIEIPNTQSSSSRVFHVCASSSSSNEEGTTFQADGLVYHTRRELDEALRKMTEGKFEVNC